MLSQILEEQVRLLWHLNAQGHREALIDFISGQGNTPTATNEVMIRDAIKPKWITHVVFSDENIKDDLLARLRMAKKPSMASLWMNFFDRRLYRNRRRRVN